MKNARAFIYLGLGIFFLVIGILGNEVICYGDAQLMGFLQLCTMEY